MKKLAFAIIISISLMSCAATLAGDVLYKTAKAAVTIPVSLISSAAALVGGAFYNSNKSNEEKREFIENFNKNNIEREKAGLAPLDLCTEKYQFDEGWAKDDPQCKKRVEAYEAGDENAL
jgi:hypothetical protein